MRLTHAPARVVKRSITARLVAMFALAALATFALIGAALYGVLYAELRRHQDEELDTHLQNLRYSIERSGSVERWPRMQAKLDTLTPRDGSVRFWVLCDDPRFVYGQGLDEIARLRQDADGRGMLELPSDAQVLRTAAASIEPLEERPAVRLIVGVDTAPFTHTLRTFLTALTGLLLSAVLVVMLLGFWIARIGLKPLQRLSLEARALRPRARAQRLQAASLPVELSDLAVAFNGAFERLEGAYEQLEAFNADVAHELRTPLANLIGSTQVALSRPRSAAQFEDALHSNLEELERMRSIINDMLFLARADQGEAATGLSETCVAHEIGKTIEFFEFVLEDKQASVGVEGELQVHARMNVSLFRRALSNLLQNAIDHSAPGARLVVEIARHAGAVWIRVSNPGATIAEPHLPRLFDRFYRVDTARHDTGERHGHGLGLAIVRAVASMHGGTVAASSHDGVTTIGFCVPGV